MYICQAVNKTYFYFLKLCEIYFSLISPRCFYPLMLSMMGPMKAESNIWVYHGMPDLFSLLRVVHSSLVSRVREVNPRWTIDCTFATYMQGISYMLKIWFGMLKNIPSDSTNLWLTLGKDFLSVWWEVVPLFHIVCVCLTVVLRTCCNLNLAVWWEYSNRLIFEYIY